MLMDIISNIDFVSGLLLAIGLALIAAEFLIPGFGIFGIAGLISLAAFVAMVAQTPMQLLVLVTALFIVLALIFLIIISFVSKKKLPSSIRLDETIQSNEGGGTTIQAPAVGTNGKSVTPLRPSGRAEFGDKTMEVQTDGDFIDKGSEVTVIRFGTDGRVFVRKV